MSETNNQGPAVPDDPGANQEFPDKYGELYSGNDEVDPRDAAAYGSPESSGSAQGAPDSGSASSQDPDRQGPTSGKSSTASPSGGGDLDSGTPSTSASSTAPGVGATRRAAAKKPAGPATPGNARPKQRPAAASGSAASPSSPAGAASMAKDGLDDARRRKAGGASAGEAAAGAAAAKAAEIAADKYSFKAVSALKKTKLGRKVVDKTTEQVGNVAAKGYRRAATIIGVVVLVCALILTTIIVGLAGVFSGAQEENVDACLNDIRLQAPAVADELSDSQQRTVQGIVRAAADKSAGMNTVAFATMISYAENGLSPRSDLSRTFVGAFQQSPEWHYSSLEDSSDPRQLAIFGTDEDPRLDPYQAASKFIGGFKTRMKTGNVGSYSKHESTEAVRAALTQLGVELPEPGDPNRPQNWWKAWKKADLSTSFNNPANRDAVLTLANWVQGFEADTGLPAAESNSSDASNFRRKIANGAQLWQPFLDAQHQALVSDGAQVASAVAAGDARAQATRVAAGLAPDDPTELNIDGVAAPEDQLAGVFVLGDSLSVGIRDDLEDAGFRVEAQTGRPISGSSLDILRTPAAQGSGIWVIQLGTNNGASPETVQQIPSWVNKVKNMRNPAAPQEVFWVLPWRPEDYPNLGSAEPIAQELRAQAAQNSWLRVLDWPALIDSYPDNRENWFATDTEVHPTGLGQDELFTLMSAVGSGNESATDSFFIDCVGGVSDSTQLESFVTSGQIEDLGGTQGKFVDGPAPEDAPFWVPQALRRASQALVDPPCEDGRCDSLCAQLAARVQGQAHSGQRSARALWYALKARGLTVLDTDPNGYAPPVGSMLFWDIGEYGHVATYVGNGEVVTNYQTPGGNGVVKMTAALMTEKYGREREGYYGWALPPNNWKPKKFADEAKAVRKAARQAGTSIYYY